jgi:hypothetical protein
MPKPENIAQLRDQLLDAFEAVKSDPSQSDQVAQLVKVAGVVIAGVKCELEYAFLRRDAAHIPFLHYPSRDELSVCRNPNIQSQQILKQIHQEIDPALSNTSDS